MPLLNGQTKAGDATEDSGRNQPALSQAIAIIGFGCRYARAEGPRALWRLLCAGGDAIGPLPAARLDKFKDYYDETAPPGTPGRIATRQGGFLARVDLFDAGFFGISPREAASMDPQQRLLLEVAWEALEEGGQTLEALAERGVGVFVGASANDWAQRALRPAREGLDLHSVTGAGIHALAGRLSHAFSFTGPSLTLDTASSSSLVAVQTACQSLRAGECDVALAGGVSLILEPAVSLAFSRSQMLAPDGRCKFGAAAANGYARGEGCGVVVLKPLARALAEGDPIHALILGGAVGNNGQQGLLVAPSRQGQEALLRRACRAAGVAPGQIDYVEAHGTGTPLGDVTELQALGAVLGEGRPAERPLWVGSIKTNLGHAEAAAGVAGLIKAALCLEHRLIPPNLHFDEPNPAIPWAELPLAIPTEPTPLADEDKPALAGVSSFGITGTNAHMVLQEFCAEGAGEGEGGTEEKSITSTITTYDYEHEHENSAFHIPFVLPLSARSPEALKALAGAWAGLLREEGGAELADLLYTAAVRRTHHDCRLAAAGADREALAAALDAFARDEEFPGLWSSPAQGRPGKLVFVFSGQGAQWWAMGRQLLEREPVYRALLERIDGLMQPLAGWSLLEELQADEEHSRLDLMPYGQPALFALQLGLAELWRSWGVRPDAVLGHSMGEVPAAVLAGGLTLEQGVRVIYHRARVMEQALGHGKMAAAELSPEQARFYLAPYKGRISVAAFNGPRSVALSGEEAALDELIAELEAREVFVRKLNVDLAAHSAHMEQAAAELALSLDGLLPAIPAIPMYSTVTGRPIDGLALDAAYWQRNLRQPVQFADAVRNLIEDEHTIFLELNPHPILGVSLQQGLAQQGRAGVALGSLKRDQGDLETMLGALGGLYAAGARVDWAALYPACRCVPLPAYPWQRESYWLDETEAEEDKATGRRGDGATEMRNAEGGKQETGVRRQESEEGYAKSREEGAKGRKEDVAAGELLQELKGADSEEARREIMEAHLRRQLAAVLRQDVRRIDPDKAFRALGLDSLMAVELRNRLAAALGLTLHVSVVWNYPTVVKLAQYLVLRIADCGMQDAGERSQEPGARSQESEKESHAKSREADAKDRKEFQPMREDCRKSEDHQKNHQDEPIAVIGMGCRFPGGADSPAAFWRLLTGKVDAIRQAPAGRWGRRDPEGEGAQLRWGGFLLEDPGEFDAPFFDIPPREAERTDPQQRLLLEAAWDALEAAGQTTAGLRGSQTGVYVGIHSQSSDYYWWQVSGRADVDIYTSLGGAHSIMANRLSYWLDLRGPSMAVDTACSSSLVAVHLACQSLRAGESRLALAGGVNLILDPETSHAFGIMSILAPDGRCKTFDARANGYVRGEGCGVVVLKRLADAERDGDPILAVIRGSAVIQDGATNGMMAPNGLAQQEAVRAALRSGGVAPEQVGFVECHGTGTALGDPIEVEALGAVFGGRAPEAGPLLLGAVKSNIGHLEAAAGIAGLIKAVLCLKNEQIPPNLHFEQLNPHISLEGTPLEPACQPRPWPRGARERFAGVSSFGFGGTNAHVVLEEAPRMRNQGDRSQETGDRSERGPVCLLGLSARTPAALKGLVEAWQEFLAGEGAGLALADLAHTAGARRTHYACRAAFTGACHEAMIREMEAWLTAEENAACGMRHAEKQEKRSDAKSRKEHAKERKEGSANAAALTGLEALREQYCGGASIDWSAVNPGGRCVTGLPAYPWQRKRYWLPKVAQAPVAIRGAGQSEPAGVLRRLRSPALREAVFETTLDPEALPYLRDNQAFGRAIAPAPTLLGLALDAVQAAHGAAPWALADVTIHQALILPEEGAATVQVVIKDGAQQTQDYAFEIFGLEDGEENEAEGESWTLHLSGLVRQAEPAAGETEVRTFERRPDDPATVEGGEVYRRLEECGYTPGPGLRGIEWMQLEGDGVIGRVRLEEAPGEAATQPAMLEACLQLFPAARLLNPDVQAGTDPFLLVGVDEFRLHGSVGSAVFCEACLAASRGDDQQAFAGDARIFAEDGRLVAEACGLRFLRARRETLAPAKRTNGTDLIYQLVWRPVEAQPERARPDGVATATGHGRNWVVFADAAGLGEALASQLREREEVCELVHRGVKDRKDIRDRKKAGTAGNGCVEESAFVYLWGLDAAADGADAEALEEAALRGCEELLNRVRELAEAEGAGRPRLWLVTRGGQAVGAQEAPDAAQAALWGLGRVIAVEHPELWGGLIDLAPGGAPDEAARQILGHVEKPGGEDQVAFREGRRHVPRLEAGGGRHNQNDYEHDYEHRLRARKDGQEARATDGVVLITGGLGDLGLLAARWLIGRGAWRLVLAGRTPLPATPEGADARQQRRLAAVRELEALGAEIRTVALDIADGAQIDKLLSDLRAAGWGPVRGVIHAAAAVEDRLLPQLDRESLRGVLRPKLTGACLLRERLRGEPLEFFVLYSSIGALLGQAGQGSYAAANAALDALARAWRTEGTPAVAVDWGVWAGSGLALTAGGQQTSASLRLRGLEEIAPAQALEALGRLLAGPVAQAAVIRVNAEAFRAAWPAGSEPPLLSRLVPEQRTQDKSAAGHQPANGKQASALQAALLRELHSAESGAQRRRLLEAHLKGLVGAVLHLAPEAIEPERPLGSLGLNSLLAFELRKRCETSLGLTLSATLAWNHPTVAALARHLGGKLGLALEDEPPAAAPQETGSEADATESGSQGARAAIAGVRQLTDEEALEVLLRRNR